MVLQAAPRKWTVTYKGRLLILIAPPTVAFLAVLGFLLIGRALGQEQESPAAGEVSIAIPDVVGSISGQKWNDEDGDGVKDPGEQGLPGWEIWLDSGEIQLMATTDESGNYSFTDLPDGTYTVTEVLQDGWTQTYPSGTGAHSISTDGGQNVTDVDFGNQLIGAIHGLKWEDTNGDGVKDPSEGGLPGWTIVLQGPVGERQTTTDDNGAYWFMGLPAGNYVVSEQPQAGWDQSWPAPSGVHDVELAHGEVVEGIDFGNWLPPPGEIHGKRWYDLDGNGAPDPGEPGLDGWEVVIEGESAIFGTTTDSNGEYWVMDVPPGTYTVTAPVVTHWRNTWPPGGLYTLTLPPGNTISGVDFGSFTSEEIHGTKWHDLDGDGNKDPGEPGLAGWEIAIDGVLAYSTVGATVHRSTTTQENGDYSFFDVPLGTYTVTEVLQPGWVQSFPQTDHVLIATSGGAVNSDVNFGNWQPAEIHGRYWQDLNGNGGMDPGEPGLNSWEMTLEGGGTIATTNTDSNGDYSFTNLTAGTYTVTAELIGFWKYTNPASGAATVTLSPGEVRNDLDFGSWVTGEVYGRKWHDLNGDGSQDPDEPGLPGWEITIEGVLANSGTNEVYSDTVITDSNGEYWFLEAPLAAYTATERLQPGWIQTHPETPDTFFILSGGTTVSQVDFGNWQPAEVHGTKWFDKNGNGARDPGENGLSGWTIVLQPQEGISMTTTTNEDGNYWFMNVPSGTHTLFEIPKDGWAQSAPSTGDYVLQIAAGDIAEGLDFGNWLPSSIAGFKWQDDDADAIEDPGEVRLSGWEIWLEGANGVLSSTVTNSQGEYKFSNLPEGTYTVTEVVQPGWIQIYPFDPPYHTFFIGSGVELGGIIFANYYPPDGEIHGRKWNDLNANGEIDSGEDDLADWTIVLQGDSGLIRTEQTDENGIYWFDQLRPGTYTITEQLQEGWEQTFPAEGGYVVVLSGGEIVDDLDFGNRRSPPAEIHGHYWWDLNGNGQQDPGEPGLVNWEMTLSGDGTITTTNTDSNGDYSFTNLTAGTYTVTAGLTGFWKYTYPASGATPVTLAPGEVRNNVDFGSWVTGEIHGRKWHDLNGDGSQDPGEPGLPGWEIVIEGVLLHSSVGATYSDMALTDANGDYWFMEAPLASYTATEKLQPGWIQTHPETPDTFGISSGGTTVSQVDFGNWQPGEIHGHKWNDLDGDGIWDPAEAGLAGWEIHLQGEDGLAKLTATDEEGRYWFMGLPAGNYTVTEGIQSGWKQTYPADPSHWPVKLGPGTKIEDLDFGNRQLGSLYGIKWNDLNGNGALDSNESGIADWPIFLEGPDGLMREARTDGEGVYRFLDLEPGVYTMTEELNANWDQTWPPDGDYVVILSAGQIIEGLNFGNWQPPPGQLLGIKWNDLNGNGALDVNESGLFDWPIFLEGAGGIMRETRTDAEGVYRFLDLEPGVYTITEELRAGWEQSWPPGGSYNLTVGSGQTIDGLNFGNWQPPLGQLHGQKWNDLNGNGAIDAGESGLVDWPIFLDGPAGLQRETKTTADGAYWFIDLEPGVYTVTEELQSGWQQSWPPDGSYSLLVVPGQSVEGLNFGNWRPPPGQLHGQKWNDLNGNGAIDAGENGLSGWTIGLEGSNGLLSETTTVEDGAYWFVDLEPGVYTITEELQSGWEQSWPPNGSYSLLVVHGQVVEGLNFGNRQPPPGQLHGQKWNDLNGNGAIDSGENALTGWTIRLEGSNGVLSETTTTEDGAYWFMDLPPGTYTVTEVLQAGWRQSWPPAGAYALLLSAGQTIEGLNFGNWRPSPGELHGLKWNDLNSNGAIDSGENGLPAWTIVLDGENGLHRETTTDDNGAYWFMDLEPGVYTITEELQPGWSQSWPPLGHYTLLVGEAQTIDGLNFGNWRPAPGQIHGLKWNDLDGNGALDVAESGLANWTIRLEGPNGVLSETTTNADGAYWFMDLEPGTYTVTEVLQEGWSQSWPPPGHYTLLVAAGQSIDGLNFGNWQPAGGAVHGRKWDDANGNGIVDGGEAYLSGWNIILEGERDLLRETTTDEEGNFWFMDLEPGSYTVTEVLKDGWSQSWPPAGEYALILGPGQSVEGLNFGNRLPPPGQIHGLKWNDLDGDGVKDPGEPGLSGWLINLTSNGDSWSTTTDDDGKYWFMDLRPGSYAVRETEVAGWQQTAPQDGAYTVTLESAQTVEDLDFGNWRPSPGEIHGVKWNDLDGDGIKDPGEPGLPGWTIFLFDSSGRTWHTITDEEGKYWFMELLPGTHTVIEDSVTGWQQTAPADGKHTITVGAGQTVEDVDFGNWQPSPGEIHGLKWNDLDGDGVKDPAEPGLSGWTIFLVDDEANTWSTVTDDEGAFWFMELPPGSYTVQEVPVSGWQQTWPSTGSYSLPLDAGQTIEDVDFGNWQPPPGEIHGIKWNDLDGDGVKDAAEPPLFGWTIILVDGESRTWSTVTDDEGAYWFIELPPGSYTVSEALESGWEQTWPSSGSYHLTLSSGQTVEDLDFGNRRPQPGEIHGMKWHDLDRDGVKDPGEPGVDGWIIILTDEEGNARLTTTDKDGKYWFMDLLPGTYTVREPDLGGAPSSWRQSFPPSGSYTVTLASGQVVEDLDFGNWEVIDSHIYGQKWHDLDGDGVKDTNEPGLSGWTIAVNGGGALSALGTTSSNGVYSITVGAVIRETDTFTVSEYLSPPWQQTFPAGGVHVITLPNGQTVQDVDFGNWQPAPGDIHGTKWHDLDGDGVRDGAEPGLAGWTILLTGEDGAIRTTVTDDDGAYWFMDLAPGDYVLREDKVPDWQQTAPAGGAYTLTLASGQTLEERDFGNWRPPPGEIHGLKWHDEDGDGVQDEDEPGLPGWTIVLTDDDGNTWTAITDDEGAYWFMDLLPGTYTVAEVLPEGWQQTWPSAGEHAVTLAAGQSVEDRDFGNRRQPDIDRIYIPTILR